VTETREFRFDLTDTLDPEGRDYIHQQIRAFNDAMSEHHRAVRKTGTQPLDISVRDRQGHLMGGLVTSMYWGWLEIEYLWLDERLRGQGYGREMMVRAETEAKARGCGRAFVRTFSFQAKRFYEKLGYEVVGELKDYPPGQTLFWLRKDFPVQSEKRSG
jgi:ribosomal protein S18 acetylase RimI-like enzyme